MQYLSEDHLANSEINADAEFDAGILVPWRIGADGKRWFKRELPALRGAVIKGVTEPRCTIGSQPEDNPNGAGVEQLEIEVFESDDE